MGQVTWRADDDLIDRAKDVAAEQGRSLNDYLTTVVDAATDPATASDEAQQIRERLARAGLLGSPPPPPPRRPDPDQVAAARRQAGAGRPLEHFVSEGRDP